MGEGQEEGIVPCSCCFFHSSYLSTWRLCHQPYSMTPIKGTNAISIAHIIHIRYSSVVFRSFAEIKSPIMINSIAPAKPASIIKYCGNSPRNTLPKNNVPNMSCPRFTRTFPPFSLMSVFLPTLFGFFSFAMPIIYRFYTKTAMKKRAGFGG